MERTFVGPVADPDKYELVEQKSQGGEGEVWRGAIVVDGVHVPVAVKRILPRNDERREEWQSRWERQAEMLRSLVHPRVVQVREVFVGPEPHGWTESDLATSSLYLVMNWAEGPTLTEWVARNPNRDLLESIRMIGGVAEAIDHLHSGTSTGQAVMHRDIKPSNVIVTDGGPVLVDFGFVRGVSTNEPMTIVGSPDYAPPESATGNFTPASDLYSLGATAYFAITGEAPVPEDREFMREQLGRVRGLEGRRDLIDHLLAMLDPDPVQRPSSAIEWAQTLGAMSIVSGSVTTIAGGAQPIHDTPKPKRRRRVAVLALVLLLLGAGAVGAAILFSGDDPEVSTDANPPAGEESNSEEPATSNPGEGEPSIPVDEEDDPPAPSETTPIEDPVETTPTQPPTYNLPNFEGMTLAEFGQLAADEDFVPIIEEVDYAGTPGLVLTQDPGVGIPISRGDEVTVTASRVAVMPDAVALGLEEATAQLEALGAKVVEVEVYQPDGARGTAVAQDPPPGAAVPSEVTLSVVGPPGQVFLEQIQILSYDDTTTNNDLISNGDTYLHSVYFQDRRNYGNDQSFVTFRTGTRFDRLRGTLTSSDSSSPQAVALVEIFNNDNGDLLETYTVNFRDRYELNVKITDIVQLKILVTDLSGRPQTFIGNALFIGPPEVAEEILSAQDDS